MFSESLTAPAPETDPERRTRLRRRIKAGSLRHRSGRKRLLLAGLGALTLGVIVLGAWWSIQPSKFDVLARAQERLGSDPRQLAPGAVTVATAMHIGETLLDKPGGWIHNDQLPPGLYLDNMPSWEYGALTELRDSVRAFRNDFSRAQTQSLEHEALQSADARFSFDPGAWLIPSAEQEYRTGIAALGSFLEELKDGNKPGTRFYTRADNLAAYLAVVEKRLGAYGQRLVASVGDDLLSEALAGSGAAIGEISAWHEVDNTFHEARGYSWALLHMMKALAVDFEEVLRLKNAEVSMQQVIRDLELATQRSLSPMVLNGHGFGVLANHSLVLASYIARTNAAVLDLRQLLQRG